MKSTETMKSIRIDARDLAIAQRLINEDSDRKIAWISLGVIYFLMILYLGIRLGTGGIQ